MVLSFFPFQKYNYIKKVETEYLNSEEEFFFKSMNGRQSKNEMKHKLLSILFTGYTRKKSCLFGHEWVARSFRYQGQENKCASKKGKFV